MATTTERGPNFTATEDLMACKAFMRASDDPAVGANQKATQFKAKLHEECLKLVSYCNQKFNTSLSERSPNSVFNRFKKLSKLCLKLIGVETAVGDPPSGDNDQEEWEKQVKDAFLERNPDGSSIYESVITCKNFLQDFPKWRIFQEDADAAEEGNKKRARPEGNKKAKEKQADKKLVMSVLNGSVDSSAAETKENKKEAFMLAVQSSMSEFATAFSKQMSNAAEMKLLDYLPEDKRETLANELCNKMMSELRDKKKQKTQGNSSGNGGVGGDGVPNSINVSSPLTMHTYEIVGVSAGKENQVDLSSAD